MRPPASLDDIVDIAIDGTEHERTLSFGPIPLRLRGEDHAALDEITALLAPGAGPSWRPLTVATITSRTLPAAHLPPELVPVGAEQLAVARQDGIVALAAGGERTLWLFDAARSVAVRWAEHDHDVPIWERLGPLRNAGRWWAGENGASMAHTGAVADARGAVLLVGNGGAGKSTTTMSCLGSTLDVLGDDYCFVSPPSDAAGPAAVHAAYRLAKLDDRSLGLLPHLRSQVFATGLRGKSAVRLDAVATPTRVIRAVCHVVQRPGEPTEAIPMSRIDALRAVAPSSMFQGRLFEQETWDGLAATVRSVPCYRLFVGDLESAPGVLSDLLGQFVPDRFVAADS
jgi:hypothetical protein